ncbi:MAG: DUF4881 domain-containing protein [Desulfobaccales bacterium]
MAKSLNWLIILLIMSMVLAWGCGDMGKVEQGRVIAFDKDKGTVTFIREVKGDAANPDYSGVPLTFALPKEPSERGGDPKVGLRMKLDTKAKEIVIFDAATQGFKKIAYTLIDQKENVAKDDPLVAGKKFPQVDKAKKAITIYSGRQKILTTFSVPDEYLGEPDNTWDAGDEVRVYYKQPGQALRFMNVTKTDIFKG